MSSSKSKQSTGTVPKANKGEKKVEKPQERRTSQLPVNGYVDGACATVIDRDHPPKLENIENQNIGNNKCCMENNGDTFDEHLLLERKLCDLYTKKEQMASLVDELQIMNEVAQRSLNRNPTPVRNVPIEYERIVPIELIQSSKNPSPLNSNFRISPIIPQPVAEIHEFENGEDDESTICSTVGGNDDSLSDKIAEINTMKNQLQRLKNLMNTVKIIEVKNGDYEDNDNVSVDSSPSHANQNDSHYENILSMKRDSTPSQQPEHEEESDMDERVRLLQSMTQDLKLQAVSIAEERDRLRDIKNEMSRRRDNEGLKKITNLNQTRLEDKPQEQVLSSDGPEKSVEQSTLYKDNSWNPSQYGLTNGSARSNFERQSEQFTKSTQLPPVVPGKISSNATIGMSADVRSLNSNSSRGISLPPPMRNFGPEERPSWMKSIHETPRLSSMNQQNLDNTHDWQHSNNYCNLGPQSMGPQSPQFHCHHSVNSDQNYNCRPMYYPSLSSHQSGNSNNDHALLQQFIQTQQMLINSVCQFNQLLWDQQREINNLNTAVLLIQERMFNSTRNGFNESLNSTRAETLPPNVAYNNTYQCHARAQSEQSTVNHNGCASNCQSHSPYGQYPFTCQSHPAQVDAQPNNIRSRRFNNNIIHHNQVDSSACCYPTHLLNNDLHTSNSSNCQTNSSPSYLQQQNNNAANNIANSNNQLRQQNIAVASPALNNQVPPGNRANNYWDNFRSYSRQNLLSSNSCKSNEEASSINNLPQNRERDQSHQNQSSRLSTHMTHNNLPLVANKYSIHFQNQTNQQQQQQQQHHQNASHLVAQNLAHNGLRNPDDLNINSMNQQLLQQSNDVLAHDQFNSINNLNMNFAPFHQPNEVASNFMNSINLELNELKPNTSKMLPKRSTGGHKRKPQTQELFEQNNLLVIQQVANGIDSKTVMTNDTKSSEKSFEALKEHVYQEVSALIVANESRPNFLINLFRELQLISTSDPLRNRLMQTFHDLYNRYGSNTFPAENSLLSNQPSNAFPCSSKSNENVTMLDLNRKRKNNLREADVCGENSCDGDEDLAEADQNCNVDDIYGEDFDTAGAAGFDNSSSDMVILPSSPTSNSDETLTAADELN